MHNLTKIRIFNVLLWCSYLPSLLLILPFALLKKKAAGHLFFFFDRYAIGGAQRIHLDLLKSVRDEKKQLYFTRAAKDHSLKEAFYSTPNAEVKDIHFWCDNLLLRLFTVHFYAFYINRHQRAQVFSSNSTFFYDMLPFLKKRVVKTELLHMFTFGNNGMEFFGLANYKRLDYRIIYDILTKANIEKQYREHSVPEEFLKRVLYIEPGVIVPDRMPQKRADGHLQVLYAGRGGPQKRIWILDKIAARCISEGLPVQFHFAGSMEDELSEAVKAASVLHGNITDPSQMAALNRDANILLMTSAYEGFPMAIKEAMAMGCVPVVTALEGNRSHLTSGQNSILLENVADEPKLEEEGFDALKKLCNDRGQLDLLSRNTYEYAASHFGLSAFFNRYAALLALPK